MADRTPIVAANWKMNKTVAETEAFLVPFLDDADAAGGAQVFICPPFLSLARAVEMCAGSVVRVAAQNMHEEEGGAFTGEVSGQMIAEVGADGVILGHSERRAMFGESDEALATKLPLALQLELQPIFCVGESEAERDKGMTESVLDRQITAGLARVSPAELASVVIAYEPVWAIGTGRTATTEQAQDAIAHIRSLVASRSSEAAEMTCILYGGSVKPDNAAELMEQPDVDGALVGGASLEPDSFAAIVEAAERS